MAGPLSVVSPQGYMQVGTVHRRMRTGSRARSTRKAETGCCCEIEARSFPEKASRRPSKVTVDLETIIVAFTLCGIGLKVARIRCKYISKNFLPQIPATTEKRSFWFDDGTVLVSLVPSVYKVHKSILDRHSTKFASWFLDATDPAVPALSKVVGDNGTPIIAVPGELGVTIEDFEALLAHLYHDSPSRRESSFHQLSCILRVSSPRQLDLTSIFEFANRDLAALFPGGPIPFAHRHRAEYLEEALELALQYGVELETKKALLYSVATSTNFDPRGEYDPSGSESHGTSSEGAPHPALSPRTLHICHRLLASIIADFTPVLFTICAASHMGCTDAIADRWMVDVISPALADGGVGRPLETLARIASLPWNETGVCNECVESKKAEWDETAKDVWEKVGQWVEEAEKEFRN
ncbi:hypothetical protein BJV74DRAFT_984655 [Russula compacta]|nr:hypothetical protein BJV74DRAFT_984655 [Russula compacta]